MVCARFRIDVASHSARILAACAHLVLACFQENAMKKILLATVATAAATTLLAPQLARADEGMWPYNMAPVDAIKSAHHISLSSDFLDRAMKSSVRFNNGGSGSFVSKDGLVMTNHHVGSDCIAKLSQETGSKDAVKEGFLAESRSSERKCPDLELNVLMKIDDVTEMVESAAKDKKSDADKNTARKAAMSTLEKSCAEKTGLRCDVVTLYAGGAYHLYEYKKYTDVRLVFAPEFPIAFFGGDPDNFTFPREDLDVAFFRVYDDGKPLAAKDYLPFSANGPKEGDTVFVSGHPGSTDRFAVVKKLELLRDVAYPFALEHMQARREMLAGYAKRGDVEDKAAHQDFFSVENGLKAIKGYQGGLLDKTLMAEAQRRQDELRKKVGELKDKAEKKRLQEAWPKLDAAYATAAKLSKEQAVLEGGFGPSGQLVFIAKTLLRLGDELPKKNEARLREYRDSALSSLEFSLFSDAHIEPSLEIEKIALGLTNMVEVLGKNDKTVKTVLAGKTPHERAEELVKGTKLVDVAVRKELRKGKKEVAAAKDPLIEFVRSYDKAARAIRKQAEDQVESVERTYAGRVAEAMNKVYGASIYPDATFTLRLSVGVVKGYDEDGHKVSWKTDIGDLYQKSKRHNDTEPYALPKRWKDAMGKVDFSVPFNFVSTNDIIGGNSGSPVFNDKGEIVGLIFDGNIQSLPNRFVVREEQGRAVSVASTGIVHALDRVYGAQGLVTELTGK
jgi:hypothetical protein